MSLAIALLAAVAGCGDRGGVQRASVRAPADTVRVAVAGNFAAVQDSLARRFTDSTGIAVVSIVGSTGVLYAQITHGAPYDILLAADTLRPAQLEARGLAVPGTRFTYATGRLALYAPGLGHPVDSPRRLADRSIRHIAVADSATAPYGAAAMQVLARWGVADELAPRIVRGESIVQAFQFVAGGAAEAGFVALSQVVGLRGAAYYVVPDSLHDPIAQDAALLSPAVGSDAARSYLGFLKSETARSLIEAAGYTVPPLAAR